MMRRPPRLPNADARQVGVTLVVATLLAGSAFFADAAQGDWQESIRADTRWGAGVDEALRFVYVDEAPVALEIALATARAESLAASPGGRSGALASFEAEVELAWSAAAASDLNNELLTSRYQQSSTGFDVQLRVADETASLASSADDAALAVERGDGLAARAERIALAVIIVVGAFLALESGLWIAAVRRRTRPVNGVPDASTPEEEDGSGGAVPLPWRVRSPERRATAVVALIAWTLLGMLPWLQIDAANDAARAESQSARAAVQLSTAVAAGAHYNSFVLNSQRALIFEQMRSTAYEFTAAASDDAVAPMVELVGGALAEAAVVQQSVVAEMTRAPTDVDDGVPAEVAELATTGFEELDHLSSEQLRLVTLTEDASTRANGLGLSLLLATLSLTLATVSPRPNQAVTMLSLLGPSALAAAAAIIAISVSFV